ncbi:MAG: peptidoglycan DD-metalloendopeptidase family protein [Thermodesulfovibrionales bacterium]
METHREKLERAKRREHSVLDDLDDVNKRLSATEVELRKQQRRIAQIESEIKKVVADISATKGYLDKQKDWLKRRLRAMQRYGQSGDLLVLLSATDDMAGLMRRWRYLERISIYERRVIEEYAENLMRLNEKEKQLSDLRAELKRGEERARLTEASLLEKKREKGVLLASVRREKINHEKMLKELQEASKRLLEIIRKLEEKETYEARDFSALKGKLPWPANGNIAIPYGSQRDPRFNTPVFRNGIYIKTNDNTVMAVHGGKVVFADWFKGYGNLVIINHGAGYHTLYANLSETFLKVGDIIKAREVVGRVGDSGILNAPSLYFEVRYKGKPLDPAQWLKRKFATDGRR